jgi:hypothetical protein
MNANAETEPGSVSDPLGEARFLSSSSGSCHGCFARIVVSYLIEQMGRLRFPAQFQLYITQNILLTSTT